MIAESDGLAWHVDPESHDHLGPSSEEHITPRVLGLIPPGGVFVDVGAHVGHYALRAARIASRVIAVEPNPATARRLRENIALNHLTNVQVVEAVAWNGVARFWEQKIHQQYLRDGSARMLPDPGGPIWGGRLDDLLSRYPLRCDRIDAVKIDTEGADPRVIDGMTGLIARHRPVLFVEDHSVHGYYDQQDLLAEFRRLSYRAQRIDRGGLWWLARPEPAPSAQRTPA